MIYAIITLIIICLILINRCGLHKNRSIWCKELILEQRKLIQEMYKLKGGNDEREENNS